MQQCLTDKVIFHSTKNLKTEIQKLEKHNTEERAPLNKGTVPFDYDMGP